MLRFVTAGESHGQALLAWLSGLPAGVPVDLEFVGREIHRRQLGFGRGGRQRIEKDQADFLRVCGMARPLGRLSRCASRIATGKIGRKLCRSRIAMAPTMPSAT